jgi:hypothetical protein
MLNREICERCCKFRNLQGLNVWMCYGSGLGITGYASSHIPKECIYRLEQMMCEGEINAKQRDMPSMQ